LIQTTGFKIPAVVDTFVRAIETSEFERRLQEFDERLEARDAARATGAGSIWTYNRRV
jgi:hypothetical protein